MRITYNSPNRSHHAAFAEAMQKAGCLHKFVSGVSRFSPRFDASKFDGKLQRADHLQNVYLAGLMRGAPKSVTDELAYLSKIWIDRCSIKPALESDIFLFYSGAGLATEKRVKQNGVRCVVEAVNSHVLTQQALLVEESERLKAPPPGFHQREVRRRVQEYERADAVLCPSQFVKKSFLERGFSEDQIHVVPYGFTLPASGTNPVPRDDVFRVLYVGTIHLRKGLRYLIQAFARLKAPKKELLLVGPKTENTGFDDLSIPEGVRFHGVARGEELARLYQSATVFAQPSIEEGLSLVLGEALAYGLPLVATENTGARDLFADGREGFIVPIRDDAIIAEKLQQLSDDRALRQRMSESSKTRALELNGWERCGKLLMEAMRKIASAKN